MATFKINIVLACDFAFLGVLKFFYITLTHGIEKLRWFFAASSDKRELTEVRTKLKTWLGFQSFDWDRTLDTWNFHFWFISVEKREIWRTAFSIFGAIWKIFSNQEQAVTCPLLILYWFYERIFLPRIFRFQSPFHTLSSSLHFIFPCLSLFFSIFTFLFSLFLSV